MSSWEGVAEPVLRLHRHLVDEYFVDDRLVGPDPGIRFDYRIGRFVKSYTPLSWNDRLYYLQGQAYWMLANWALFARTGADEYREIAVRTAVRATESQRTDGAWEYPNPEWGGRVATNEGTWASMALLESYRRSGQSEFLDSARRWHRFLLEETGFQPLEDQLAINYFAWCGGDRVPNNSITVLRFLSELHDVTGDDEVVEPLPGMLTFIEAVQKESGEFPYTVPPDAPDGGRAHFQCYQCNAFELLNLLRCHELRGEPRVEPLIERSLGYLETGVAPEGYVRYECGSGRRRVTYHAAALGAAMVRASQQGFGDHTSTGERALGYVLGQQRPHGGFPHSRGDYGVLSDRTGYPRYMAMILYHLLHAPDLSFDRSTGKVDAS
jgi:hypothetical protein